MPIAKSDFLKNLALAAAGARFLRFWASKLGVKIDQKLMKKRSPRWMASWHRFFLDFGRFLGASWEAKWSQDRPKKASKNDAKNSRNQIAKKVATRIPGDSRHPGFWVLGGGR